MIGFVSHHVLEELGMSEGFVLKALSEFRTGKSNSWENIPNPNGKGYLVNLDSVPPRSRKKYNIPTSNEYAKKQYLEQQEALEKALQEAEKDKLFRFDKERQSLVEAYNTQWFKYLETYREWYAHNPKRCEELAAQSAKDHAFWVRMLEITGTKYKAFRGKVSVGFDHYLDVRTRVTLTTNTDSLVHFRKRLKDLREAREYSDQSFIEMIAIKNTKQNNHRQKTDEFHKALALSILSHPKVYAYRVATDLINHHCLQEGKPTVTESWVKSLMSKDKKFKTLVNQHRYGAKHFDDWLLPHAVRKLPTYPGNVWMIDGTPVQFFCWNESRTKVIRLYLFAVIDVCSRKIVGFDIAHSEDRYSIMQALKMAVMSEGHLPAEIVSDNFSANKTEEIIELKAQMEKLSVYWRHSKVRNAKDKSYIERFFGAFQSVECALYDDYIGEGIKSKRLNARPNDDFLAEIARKRTVTTKEMMHRISVMIATYNQRSLGEKKAPSTVYRGMPKPKAVEMDAVKTALMFWTKTKHTIKRGMVKLKYRKTEYCYEIHQHELKATLQGVRVAVRYDPNDLDTVMLFDLEHDTPICECRKAVDIHMSVADRDENEELKTAIIEAKNKSYNNFLKEQTEDIIDKGLRAINKDELEIAHPLSLDKNTVNAEETKLHNLFLQQKNISKDDEEERNFKPIKVITRKGVNPDAHERLLQKKEPLKLGSLKVVGKPNQK
ncbi:DDE-type integrase/transposase/recombinase [Leeuwenhoekiella parthenopeia]|uniref:DDE-type integrase/transposase/recombinase n=1 Tax=Leeuwenhoekiella parthenopeia TaxID=2890320 RepID=A0ABS8GNX4_9FLAO|nr:DDE-type integrase/transposase/recombinase [Leeuwenhoekiella parthenopeia]MCC4211707.1 DDE-type integrase/transposase/recombinase [Leeuwenhoekiella parthenopeia]